MSDIFREVDEALQKEKVAKIWKDYGPTIIACAVALVLGVAANTGWQAWKSHTNQKETGKLVLAAEEKDIASAFERAANDTDGDHKAIALMNAAAQYAKDSKFTKAAELYNTVSEDSAAPDELSDLATILYVRSVLLAGGEKAPDAGKLAERLEAIAEDGGSSFQNQAKLDAALLYGNALKDYNKALALLEGFDGEDQSDSLKEKATALTHVYEYELSKTAPAASEKPAPATPAKE